MENIPTTVVKSKTLGRVGPSGPTDTDILIVGEAPGAEEVKRGMPFVGASGRELTHILTEAGIDRDRCRLINTTPYRPENNKIDTFFVGKRTAQKLELNEFCGRYLSSEMLEGIGLLEDEIQRCQPNVILALGNTALWALTGVDGIGRWRGSIMEARIARPDGTPFKVVPTYHPAGVLRQWSWRSIVVADCNRASRESQYPEIRKPPENYITAPTFKAAQDWFTELVNEVMVHETTVSCDIETTKHKWITCIGIGHKDLGVLVVPFCYETGENYWTEAEEYELVATLRFVLTHPNMRVVGQNFLYDMQYIARYWGFKPNCTFDTMLAHHTAYAGMPKGLDFLSSLYLDWHCNWKGQGFSVGGDRLWIYNADDVRITRELEEPLWTALERSGTEEPFANQMSFVDPVFAMELRGVRVDMRKREEVTKETEEEIERLKNYMEVALGHPINPRSSPQMQKLFYHDFGLPVIYDRKTGRPTCNEDALRKFGKQEPLLKPITDAIIKQRQLGVLKNTFLEAPVDHDERIRCSYNIGGTETFRFSSSQSVFDTGTNLQNVPPFVRKLFIPDEGMMLVDCDLDRADLQVVVWEADDEELKNILREGVNIHTENAKTIFGVSTPTEVQYKQAKMGVHATNYGARPRTLAIALGVTVKEAEAFQKAWFKAHPGLWAWRERVENSLLTTRMVRNRFGYRRYYFDRIENLLPEALAWIPQSTVANVINLGMRKVFDSVPAAELLLQVHDSIVFQCPLESYLETTQAVIEALRVPIPYSDPLVIGVGAKASAVSWGDVKEVEL